MTATIEALRIRTVAVRERVGMHVWRDRLFAYMARNARPATSFFKLPSSQVVELGAQIEI